MHSTEECLRVRVKFALRCPNNCDVPLGGGSYVWGKDVQLPLTEFSLEIHQNLPESI